MCYKTKDENEEQTEKEVVNSSIKSVVARQPAPCTPLAVWEVDECYTGFKDGEENSVSSRFLSLPLL